MSNSKFITEIIQNSGNGVVSINTSYGVANVRGFSIVKDGKITDKSFKENTRIEEHIEKLKYMCITHIVYIQYQMPFSARFNETFKNKIKDIDDPNFPTVYQDESQNYVGCLLFSANYSPVDIVYGKVYGYTFRMKDEVFLPEKYKSLCEELDSQAIGSVASIGGKSKNRKTNKKMGFKAASRSRRSKPRKSRRKRKRRSSKS